MVRRNGVRPRDRNSIEARVTIHCPVERVFAYYRDFRNLPSFLGDMMAVEPIGPATFRWTIQGPLGIRAHWTGTSEGGSMSAEENMKLMQTLDDAWNAQDLETFAQRHKEDVVVR